MDTPARDETGFAQQSIRYSVGFPYYRRENQLDLAQFPDSVKIQIVSLDVSNSSLDLVAIPGYVQELEPSCAIVVLPSQDSDKGRLISDLTQLGCGSVNVPTPTALPNGGTLVDYYWVPWLPWPSSDEPSRPSVRHAPPTYAGYPSISTFTFSTGFKPGDSPASFMTAPMSNITSPASFKSSHSPASFGMTPISNFASPASFMSCNSLASFKTAKSTYASPAFGTGNGVSPAMRIATIREDEPLDPTMPARLQKLQRDYYSHLRQQEIVQPFDKELNWSGKGQHVTFMPKDRIPLEVLSSLGSSMTAKVDKVLCRRIALARKTMRCSRQWTITEALQEVYHLQNLRHFHIVQLVGSYLQGRDFSILMYPVADCHLGRFLEDTADMGMPDTHVGKLEIHARRGFLGQSLGCLTSAIAYVHKHTTKHMDIKPQNILVGYPSANALRRVYLADFGLSRNFATQGHSQTDGPTSRTPRYCAPEVYQYAMRGRSADIFSLGCVFVEVLTVIYGRHPQDFADFRTENGHDDSFHANLPRVRDWIDKIIHSNLGLWAERVVDMVDVVKKMIAFRPDVRPTALEVQAGLGAYPPYNIFGPNWCCMSPPEQYVAYEEHRLTLQDPQNGDGVVVEVAEKTKLRRTYWSATKSL